MATILCLASYHKGEAFLRECKRLGCRVLLLTVEKLRDAEWPRDDIDDVLLMPDLYHREHVINGVSWLARREQIARIIPLDEFDLEMASALREHLRVPGMGETTVRYFRDKLAMRMRAREAGILVPEFVSAVNDDEVRRYLDEVPPPWVLKPRSSASAIGIKRFDDADEVWRALGSLEDRRSFHLIERFVRGAVCHVDAVTADRDVKFSAASAYVTPPFEVYHGGGVFCTRTLDPDSADARALAAMNRDIVEALGFVRGATHTEFIHGDDGRFYFLETAARVGGAYIVDMLEAATGANLWREWARVEVADIRGERYEPPPARGNAAGLLLSLARQEWPDTSHYADPEIVERIVKRHHAGLIVASPSARRVNELLREYLERFRHDYVASMPAPERPTD